MSAHPTNEAYSIKAIKSITSIYRISTPRMRKLAHDINHVISAYELNDKEVAIACNKYITYSYPAITQAASAYGLHPMNEEEISSHTGQELQHILYCMCVFLYDNLEAESVAYRQHLHANI